MTIIRDIMDYLKTGWWPGESRQQPDGSTLQFLGRAENKWDTRTCNVCGGPATQYKRMPPWPGTKYSHTSMTCDAHETYLDGHIWAASYTADGALKSRHDCGPSNARCLDCDHPPAQCDCPQHTEARAIGRWQDANAVRGRL